MNYTIFSTLTAAMARIEELHAAGFRSFKLFREYGFWFITWSKV